MMEKDKYKYLYPVLDLLANKPDAALSSVTKVLETADRKALAKEAKTALTLLGICKEPKFPFEGMLDDASAHMFANECAALEKAYGFVVWTNQQAGSDEACADIVRSDPDYYFGMPEADVRQISYDSCRENMDILKSGFDAIDAGTILIIEKIGRWNGEKYGYSLTEKMGDVFTVFTGDDCTLYIEDGQLKAENRHHDGIDYFTFFKIKDDVNLDKYLGCTAKELMAHEELMESLVPVLNSHFKWDLEKERSKDDGKSENSL